MPWHVVMPCGLETVILTEQQQQKLQVCEDGRMGDLRKRSRCNFAYIE